MTCLVIFHACDTASTELNASNMFYFAALGLSFCNLNDFCFSSSYKIFFDQFIHISSKHELLIKVIQMKDLKNTNFPC